MRPSFSLSAPALLALALAAGAPAQAQAGEAAATTAVEGRVVDVLGEPLPAAAVHASVNGRVVARTTADGEGIYRIRIPATGAELQFHAEGKVDDRLAWRGLPTPGVRNVVLEDGACLRGRVVDAEGRPAGNALVLVVAPGTRPAAMATTAADGTYEVRGVPLRAVMLRAVKESTCDEARLRLTGDSSHDFTLRAAARGECLVRVNGLPAAAGANAVVRVFGSDLAAVQGGGRVPLRADGTAGVMLRSDCVLDVQLAGFELTPTSRFVGAGARFADFAVVGPIAATAGTVLRGHMRTLANRVVGGVRLVVRDRSQRELGAAVVDTDGSFRVQVVLPPDRFCRVGLALGEWLLIDDELSIADGFSWVPTARPDERIDLLVEPTGTLHGVVRGPDGAQFALADLVVADCERLHSELVHTCTDRAGRFAFGLPPGEHELLAVAHDGQVCRATLRVTAGRSYEPAWQPVLVGEVSGVLRDGRGGAVPGVELFLTSNALRDHDEPNASARQQCRVVTDRLGRFRCRGLPAGGWTIGSCADAAVQSTEVDLPAGKPVAVELAYGR